MRLNLINIVFIFIGIMIGIILSLQIRANPVSLGSFPLKQLEIQKSLLDSFSLEQRDLKQKLDAVETKINEAQQIVEKKSPPKVLKLLDDLKSLTGLNRLRALVYVLFLTIMRLLTECIFLQPTKISYKLPICAISLIFYSLKMRKRFPSTVKSDSVCFHTVGI